MSVTDIDIGIQAKDVKILVIDDNEMNLEVIQVLLKRTGVWIDVALNGEGGLAKADCVLYDLILLDLLMPGMDGIETLRRLQQLENIKGKKTPIIALTANTVIGAREEYLQKGFTDYIAKPVDYRTLISVLKKYLPDKIEKYHKVKDEQAVCEEALELQGIHVKSAMKYAGNEFEQYIHLLELFTAKTNMEKQTALQQAYETQNWKDYTTYVHSLKNEARTIGADKLADMAYEHEQKSKEGDIAFLMENYQTLIVEWKKTREIISSYLNIHDKEKQEILQNKNCEKELTAGEWKEILEQAISYLAEYKKKEAFVLLQNLSADKIAEGERHNLERAIQAVQEYDYESAIHILRKI